LTPTTIFVTRENKFKSRKRVAEVRPDFVPIDDYVSQQYVVYPMNQEIPGTLLLDPKVIEDPYPFYRQLHRHAPVWQVPGTEVFAVSSLALLAEAAGRVEDFSSNMPCLLYRDENGLPCRLPFGDSAIPALATADPPIHTLHRSTVFPNFVAKRMALLEPEIVDLATRCVERALDKRSVDFMAEVANVVPITVISRLIGFRNSDLDRLLRTAFDSTELVGATLSRDRLIELVTRSNDIGAWIADLLALAANEPGEDILSSIGHGVEIGALSAPAGIVILQTLLAAGGESTTSLIGNAVRLMADHQDLQQHLSRQRELIPNFVEEALRLESPFRHHLRWVPRDTTLGDVDIPAGAMLMMLWGAANRDPAAFERPDEIVLDRPRRHVAFGRDIHFCVGAPLARLEARVVLTVLLDRTSSITLDPGQPPRWVDSLMVRRHEHLPVRLVPR
jgi:cytochrome P450